MTPAAHERRAQAWAEARRVQTRCGSARFSSTSGTTSAMVASATRSRFRRTAGWSAPSSASPSLWTTPVPQLRERVARRPGRDDRTVGKGVAGRSGGRSRRPRETALPRLRDLFDPVIPQSTVRTSPRLVSEARRACRARRHSPSRICSEGCPVHLPRALRRNRIATPSRRCRPARAPRRSPSNADAPAAVDGRSDRLDRRSHVASTEADRDRGARHPRSVAQSPGRRSRAARAPPWDLVQSS